MAKRTVPTEFLNDVGAARFLSIPVPTLRRWRHEKRGPKFYKLENRLVRYKVADLRDWAEGKVA
jgi:predicted DNA-binding transcriptional regulator AlpA